MSLRVERFGARGRNIGGLKFQSLTELDTPRAEQTELINLARRNDYAQEIE
jgi:hypothetical protein